MVAGEGDVQPHLLIHSFIHLLNKYLLSTHCVPRTTQNPGNLQVNKTQTLSSRDSYFVERDLKTKSMEQDVLLRET